MLNKKTLLILTLSLTFLLTAAACGGPDPVEPSLSGDAQPSQATPDSNPSESAPAEPSAPVENDEVFDIHTCSDDSLMYFILNEADGADAEGAQNELGERFLERPGDILSTMTWFIGVQPGNWPDGGQDGADWLVQMLASEFAVMRSDEDQERFTDALAQFGDEDCGGMARNVRDAFENYAEP